ncbi:hypothetical protein RSAG8_13977, partial [Rhizoctonia solani AG-8 WAC10335]
MPRETPFALQKPVPVLFYNQKRPVGDIYEIIGTSTSTVYSILKNYRAYGTPHNPLARTRGCLPLLGRVHLDFISQAIAENPVIYQDEIQTMLCSTFGISVSLPTSPRDSTRLGVELELSRMRVTEISTMILFVNRTTERERASLTLFLIVRRLMLRDSLNFGFVFGHGLVGLTVKL